MIRPNSIVKAALLASTVLALLGAASPAQAQDATWLANPGSIDASNGANWSTGTVPSGTAYFDATSTSSGLWFSSATTTFGGWTFNAGASDYAFTNNNQLYFNGAGIAVNGGSVTINSYNTLMFLNNSTAGSATITNYSDLQFFDTSTAGTATITNNNTLGFITSSTAGSSTITNNSDLRFSDSATAGSATLINNGGGTVDFSNTTGPNGDHKVSAGSIAGAGNYILGANELTVGSNNLSTEVSGVISGSGSLVKVGTGTLMLTGANTYTGGTTISGFGSELWLGNTTGGVGSILGAVTVGSGSRFNIVNADTSGITTIANNGITIFYNGTTAGSATITNDSSLMFANSSSAGNATITNNANLFFFSSAGNAAITNNYVLSFRNTATADSATITSSNANFAIFTYFYDNSTAGSANITNGYNSYLNFFNSSTAGSASFTNNSYMYFKDTTAAGNAKINNTNGTTFFYNNSTGGDATITNNAGGTTYFYENSTAGNAQLINNAADAVFDFSYGTGPNGDNKLTAGSIAGDGRFSLGANTLTVGSNNLSTTVSGVIVDGGANGGTGASLVKTGTGTLTLTGTNTYTGGTTFSGGTVSVASDANLGDAAGGLTFNGGALQVTGTAFSSTARAITLGAGGGTFDIANAANTFAITQGLTGTGGLTKTGAGALTFSGASTYTGATTISAGTLTIQGSIASSTITNNATLVYSNSASAGTASITNNNQLTFYSNTTAGSATITNLGTVLFDGNSTAGNAQLINSGSSAVVNFWTPGPASDGLITAGSLAGSGRFDLNSAELTVGSNNLSTEVTGVLTGDGLTTGTSLIKTGTGTLTLSGTNTYTGATIVDGGALLVNGSIADSALVFVNPGATLGGTGTVAATFLDSGATLAPGTPASIGTLTVNTTLTFCDCSTYAVKVSATDADKTVVNGTAALAGTVQATALAGSFRSRTYTILNATGGLGGTQFDGLTIVGSFAPGARNPHLTYDANNVYLLLDPGTLQLSSSASGNQSSVASGINSAVLNGGTPPAAFDALLNMSGAQLGSALNQVSGQTGAATQQAAYNASNQFMTAVFDPFAYGRGLAGSTATGGEPKPAPAGRSSLGAMSHEAARTGFSDPRLRYWGTVYGGNTSTNGSGGASDTTSRAYGIVAGADVALSPDTMLGFALGGGQSSFGVSDGLGGGDADMVQTGVFAKHAMGAAYFFAGLSYTYQDVTTNRTVTVSGADELEAKFDANTFGGRIEGGYRYATPFAAITPYAALQVTQINLPGYEESAASGSSAFALNYDANHTTVTRTELGARFDRAFRLDNALLTLRSRIAWAHDEGNDSAVSASFLSLPGSAFAVNGAVPSKDLALVSVGAEMKWQNNLSVVGTFEGEFSENTVGYAGKGAIRYAW